MDRLDTVGNWGRNPSDLTITTGDKYITNVTAVWRNQNSGDVLVITDLIGVSGEYTIHHIPEEYVNSANEWLKKLHIQTDSAKYSHGAVIERMETKDGVMRIAEEYMRETEELDE